MRALCEEFSRPVVLDAVKDTLDKLRARMEPSDEPPPLATIAAAVRLCVLHRTQSRLRPVVNATGIILHTGLGRAVLPVAATDALAKLDRCCNMQVDLEEGTRGWRNRTCEELLCRLTGAEAAMIVNNNAAATYLILAALCTDREVIVSQGQLIEIGGSFRLPDCITQSGAIMVRVGTTNRTHLRDYEGAITENTGALFRANPSNYRVVGFCKEVSTAELVSLKAGRDLLVIDDLGCGALVDTETFGLPREPTVQESLAAGADLACFSGDKLIGGPQSGIIVGKKELVHKIKKHPLTRMMRVCKLTDTALQQSLRLFLDPGTLLEHNPTLRMLSTRAAELERPARELCARIEAEKLPLEIEVLEEASAVGGGSMPDTPIATFVLAVRSPDISVKRLSTLLRRHEPPVIGRISGHRLLLDVRTLLDGDDEVICRALRQATEAASA